MHDIDEYGSRLTVTEYERRLVELHRGLSPEPTAAVDAELQRRVLNLSIDHRLGIAFPRERRAALWAVHHRLEKRRLWLALRYYLRKVLPRGDAPGDQHFAREVFDEYATVLSARELEAFLGVADRASAALPIEQTGPGAPRGGRKANGT